MQYLQYDLPKRRIAYLQLVPSLSFPAILINVNGSQGRGPRSLAYCTQYTNTHGAAPDTQGILGKVNGADDVVMVAQSFHRVAP